MNDESDVALFAYGTLQQANVQLATFGRLLEGRADVLSGYVLAPLKITDPRVVRTSGLAVHTAAEHTGNFSDRVPGIVYKLSAAELGAADEYEVDDMMRVERQLDSGMRAFVYVKADREGA